MSFCLNLNCWKLSSTFPFMISILLFFPLWDITIIGNYNTEL